MVVLHDGEQRRLRIASSSFADSGVYLPPSCNLLNSSLVLFNPWIDKSRNLVDMNDDGYLNMVAIEPGSVSSLVSLAAGSDWSGSEMITLLHE